MSRPAPLALLLAATALPVAAQQVPPSTPTAVSTAPTSPEAKRLYEHVRILADDGMRGREAGTADYDRAAAYVADQLQTIGAKPAGTQGWYQPVPLVGVRVKSPGSLALVEGGRATPLVAGRDYIPGIAPAAASVALEAPVVFVGQGVHAPGEGVDDYAGIDVRGKIVAFAPGAPDGLQGEIRAHFGRLENKAAVAKAKGAVGTVTLLASGVPIADLADNWRRPQVTWRTPDGRGFSAHSLPSFGALSAATAIRMFGNGAKPGSVARMSLRAAFEMEFAPFDSRNVVGLLPGSDPALASEYVVLTAHLDHVGVGEAVNGDRIYNGALDNAVGVGSMIEAGRALAAAPHKRPVLLVALTAEEKGLIGSDYFARNPTVPRDRIVANVNLDMPIITYPFTDMFAFGADRSTLGPVVRAALAPLSIALTPDPDPREALFTRSDHYRFIQQGIPSLFLKTGFAGLGETATRAFRSTHYHQPSDEIGRAIDWEAGGKFVRANTAIIRAIADMPERPVWNRGDFFGTSTGGPMAR